MKTSEYLAHISDRHFFDIYKRHKYDMLKHPITNEINNAFEWAARMISSQEFISLIYLKDLREDILK